MVVQPAVDVERLAVVSRVAEAGEVAGVVSAGQEVAVASVVVALGAASEVAVGVRRGAAEVVSRGVVVAGEAVVGASSDPLHSSPRSPTPGVGVGSVSLRGTVLHRAGISLILERSQKRQVGVVVVVAWTGYTGVIGRLWVFLLYFMVKLYQIYVVHVTVQQGRIGCRLVEFRCRSALFSASELPSL